MNKLPAIPDKKYFSIKEVSELCEVKPYTLRFWEKEFDKLKPETRKGSTIPGEPPYIGRPDQPDRQGVPH